MTAAPPFPADEQGRLDFLQGLMVLDSEPEPVFDSIARLASDVCRTPIALMTLVDADRQWFKANVGLPGIHETPREMAFCAEAIRTDAVFAIADARLDPRFADNPLVCGPPAFRFYTGAPLVMPGGARVGTLCVIDNQPHAVLDEAQVRLLESLARIATEALLMRRNLVNKSLSARSQCERALVESEARHRAIVEDQAEMVSLARPDGELIYVNPAYAHPFGRTPAQMIGANLFDFIPPLEHDAVRGVIADVIHNDSSRTSHNWMVLSDGRERWVAWTNRVQRDRDGTPMLHSVGRDVTERRLAETALRDSQAFLKRTGRLAGVGGWQFELDSHQLTWSDETRRIHDVGPDYVPTLKGSIAFYTPQARPLVEAAVEAGVATGAPWDLELQLVTATGRDIWVRAVGEVEFEAGRPVRMLGAFQDISERKRLQQRLAAGERFVRQITDSLPLRIAYVDSDRRYRFVNRAHCEHFARPEDEILGCTHAELTRHVDPLVDARVGAALAGDAQCFEFEEDVDGLLRRIEIRLIPDVAADGTVRGFYATGVDITERAAAEHALRVLTAIFDNTTDFVVQTDWRGNIVYLNPAARRKQGIAADAPLAGRDFRQFHSAETQRRLVDIIIPAVKASGMWLGETSLLMADAQELSVSHLLIGHRGADGRIDRYSSVMRDISAEVEGKRQLQRQTATLHSVIEAIPASVAVIGADRRYQFVNGSFESLFGMPRQDIVGCPLDEVLGTQEYLRSQPWIERVLSGEPVHFERVHKRHGRAHMDVSYIPLKTDAGGVDGFVAVSQDVTRHKREEVRLLQLTQRDALTGLLNRAGFEGHLESCLRSGGGGALALLYVDLDHFKPVNDRHGHSIGDQVLQEFARRLPELVRPGDAVARLGGDEFAIALSGLRDIDRAEVVASQIVQAARTPFAIGALRLSVGASVGVAWGAQPALGWRDLLARADAMLYRAKAAGRGCHAAAATVA